MHHLPNSFSGDLKNRFEEYAKTMDTAIDDLKKQPNLLISLFEAIAENQTARDASSDWTHRFVKRLIVEETYPEGTFAVIKTLQDKGFLVKSEQEELAISAIKAGRLEELMPLLDALGGIHTNLKGMTPLHFACLYGQLKIAEALTEMGASWSRTEVHGETPIDLTKDHSVDVVKTFKSLEESTYPPGISDEALEIFTKHHTVTAATLDTFFRVFKKDPMPPRYFTWIKDHIPMVKLILLQKYSLDPKDSKLLKGIAFCKEHNLITENIAERVERYESMMTTKNVAHIIGDAIIKGREEDRVSLEGHNMSQTIPLLLETIQQVINKYSARLDTKTKEIVDTLEQKLTPALKRSMKIEFIHKGALIHGNENTGLTIDNIESYTSELIYELNNLDEKEDLVLPWGWINRSGGHAMLLNFHRTSKEEWEIKVLNTGEGSQFAGEMVVGSKAKHPYFIAYEHVSNEELLDPFFLESVIEPNVVGEGIGAVDLYLTILEKRIGHRQRKLTPNEANINDFITGQRSGTCAFRVLSSYLRLSLGTESYKKFKHFMHLETAATAFFAHREAFKTKPERKRLLLLGLANIARQALKLYRGSLINVTSFKASSNQIQKLHHEMQEVSSKSDERILKVSETKRILGERQIKDWMNELTVPYPELKEIDFTKPLQKKEEELKNSIYVALSPCKNAQDLIKNIETLIQFLPNCQYYQRGSILANFLLELPFPENSFIESIQKLSVIEAKELMDKLKKSIDIARASSFDLTPKFMLAYQVAYGLTYTIACSIDDQSENENDLKLSSYQPDPRPLELILEGPHKVLGTPQLEDKARELIHYFKNLAQGKPHQPLFSFISWSLEKNAFHPYDVIGLKLPPPIHSSENRYLNALKKKMGPQTELYEGSCPKKVNLEDWCDAKLLEELNPEKKHIIHFRDIYLRNRLMVFGKFDSNPSLYPQAIRLAICPDLIYGATPYATSNAEYLIARNLPPISKNELHVLDTHPENKVYFSLPNEKRSLYTVRSEPQVTLPRLLQHFESRLSDLENPKTQEFLFLTLFHFSQYHLRDEIQKNSFFKERVSNFIEKRAIPYLQQRLTSTKKIDQLQAPAIAAIFLLSLQGRLAVYLNDNDMFRRSSVQLKTWSTLDDPKCPQIYKMLPAHRAVCQCLTEMLLIKPKLTEEETLWALTSLSSSVYCSELEGVKGAANIKTDWKDQRRESDITEAIFKHQEEIAEKMADQTFRDNVLTSMVHETSISETPGPWKGTFPNYHSEILNEQGQSIAEVKVNVISGQVTRNGILLRQANAQESNYFLYDLKNTFGQDVLEHLVNQLKDRPVQQYRTEKTDSITYFKNNGQRLITFIKLINQYLPTIEVDCRGRAFQTLSNDDQTRTLKNFPIRYDKNEVIFAINTDDGPRTILVLDRKLNHIGMLTHDGLWIKDPDAINHKPQSIEVGQDLKVASREDWSQSVESDEDHQIFRRFDPEKKSYSTVEFKRDKESGRLVWEGERGVRYFLSENQSLSGMGQQSNFVCLEDAQGKRKVYIFDDKVYEIDMLTNRPVSLHPKENAQFAQMAILQGEYSEALHYLDQMTLSIDIGFDALKILQEIFLEKDKDTHPNSTPLRIKAAHIALKALRSRPLLKEERRSLKEDEVAVFDYWSEENPDMQKKLIEHFLNYFSREDNIDEKLKLTQCIGSDVVIPWLSEFISKNASTNPELINALLALIDPALPLQKSHPLEPINDILQRSEKPYLYSWRALIPAKSVPITDFASIFPKLRPGQKFSNAFRFLYKKSTTGTEEDKKQVQQVIDTMRLKAERGDLFLIFILEAILHPEISHPLSADIRRCVDTILESNASADDWRAHPNDTIFEDLKKHVEKWPTPQKPFKLMLKRMELQDILSEKLKAAGHLTRLKPLPTSPPLPSGAPVLFNTTLTLAPYEQIREHLNELPAIEASQESLPIPPFDSEYAKRRFETLNQDFKKGQEINRRPNYRVDKHELPVIIDTLKESLEEASKTDLKTPIIALVNHVPPGTLEAHIQNLEIIAGQRTPLSIDDCILSFLRQDNELLRNRNPHLSLEDANKVREMVGAYLYHRVEVWRLRHCIEKAENLQKNKNPAIDDDLVELFRQVLESKCAFDPTQFTALLVFEYYAGEFLQTFVRLQPNQVEGIKDMLQKDADGSYPSLSIQRIMGAGKTFVFGTVMALLKADGYHLSLHVPPSALFATNTSDMLQRVVRFFQQKGQAIHFTRTPEHIDEKFLTHFYKSLHNAVINREVVLAAPETLLSIRNRTIELLDISSQNPIDAKEGSLRLLEKIIALTKSRGVATLDEIDITLAPNKEHNFPTGERTKIDSESNFIIEKIFDIAATDPEISLKLKLEKNQQSHLTLEQRKEICSQIALKMLNYLIDNEPWKARLLLWILPPKEKESMILTLHQYLMDHDLDPPPIVKHLKESSDPLQNKMAEHIILIKKELSDWLPEGWQRNLQEHYGRSHKDPDYSLARPYVANNTPNETSEFADRWEMINRTFHMYLNEGLSPTQTRDWIAMQRKNAESEWELENGEKSLNEVESALFFEELTGKKLYELDDSDIEEIQKALTNGTDKSITAILNFARQQVLDQVEMPLYQISSNAQSLCSLFKTTQGYSGTMECADTFPESIKLQPEIGTNGKTIDLLHRKKSKFHVLENEGQLLDTLLKNHSQLDRIHAIIDVGAYFRGQSNQKVAEQIAHLLKTKSSKIKGVIYFDQENNWPAFIFNNDPNTQLRLPNTDPNTISLATGLSVDEIFTYYDQRNITGVDIRQSFDAVALTTISETSSIRDVLQGVGRMRALQYSQEVEFVLTNDVVTMMQEKLAPGLAPISLDVPHLFVFVEKNETAQQMRFNFYSVIQKINNEAQEVILKRIFNEYDWHKKMALYTETRTLFTKIVKEELYTLYAKKREPIAALEFLNQMTNRLIDLITPLVAPNEAQKFKQQIEHIIEKAESKKMLPLTVDSKIVQDAGRGGTMEQEKTHLQEQERKQEQKKEVVQNVQDSRSTASESPWSNEVLINHPNFPYIERCPKVDSLNSIFKESLTLKPYASLFKTKIDLTINFRQTLWNETKLYTAHSKEVHIILAINQEGRWRFLLGSLKDMARFRPEIHAHGKKSPLSIYMLHPNGTLVADGKGDFESERVQELKDPKSELAQGLVEILILQGDVKALSSNRWFPALRHWLSEGDQDLKKAFIETYALNSSEKEEAYSASRFEHMVNTMGVLRSENLAAQKILSLIENLQGDDLDTLKHYLSLLQQMPQSVSVQEGINKITEMVLTQTLKVQTVAESTPEIKPLQDPAEEVISRSPSPPKSYFSYFNRLFKR